MGNGKFVGSTVVFDANDEYLVGLKVVSITETNKARILMAPVETGQMSLDNKVIDPREVTVSGYVEVDDADTITKLDEMHESRDFKFFKIMNAGLVTNNLVLVQYARNSNTDMLDMYKVDLVYHEAMMIQSTGGSPKSPDHSATASTGRVS